MNPSVKVSFGNRDMRSAAHCGLPRKRKTIIVAIFSFSINSFSTLINSKRRKTIENYLLYISFLP